MPLPAALLASLLLAGAPAAPATVQCGGLTARAFPDARQAFLAAVEGDPAVIGVGEYHEVEGRAPKVKSAIKRFTEVILPALKGRAGHLVAETWMKSGRCGEAEKQAVKQIEQETQRPAQTEDEVGAMLERGYDLGIEPHILKVECEDYADVLGADGEIDNVRLLRLVTRLLEEKALELWKRAPEGKMAVVLYGGALHNELQPPEELAEFSFAPALQKALAGRYRQVTLVVPEYVEGDPDNRKEPWWECLEKAPAGKVLLVSRGEASRYLLFPRTARAKAKAPRP
jgi:hypothetical protein